MKTLYTSINRECFVRLIELIINHLTAQTGKHSCLEPYREFLSENSPACGLLQLGNNKEVVDPLQ